MNQLTATRAWLRRNLFSDVFVDDYLPENLSRNHTFLKFLVNTNLDKPLTQLGMDLAQQTAALLMDRGEDEDF